MNPFLAQYFGTNATPEMIEEQSKQAEAETFVQLAKEAGIDLNQYSDEQVAELYEQVMGKTASDDGDEDDEEKKEKAKEEFEAKKESQAKLASMLEEGTTMGQIIAHSMWNELGEIQKEAGRWSDGAAKAKEMYGKAKGRGKALLEHALTKRDEAGGILGTAYGRGFGAKLKGQKASIEQLSKENPLRAAAEKRLSAMQQSRAGARKAVHRAAAKGGAGLALAGAAGKGVHSVASGREKDSAAALNELALELAVEKCAEAGWDVNQAVDRLVGVINLDLIDDDNTKIAYAQNIDGAVEIRALELIEAAGYPVTWGE